MPTTNYALWFTLECQRVAEEAFKALCGPLGTEAHYLWYRPRGLALAIAPEKPDGFELGCAERVPGDRTVQQLSAWVHDRSSRLPILPGD